MSSAMSNKTCFLNLLVAFSTILLSACTNLPSDENLIRNFNEHKKDLELILQMSSEDKGMYRVAFDWLGADPGVARPEAPKGITEERWNEYTILFRKVGLSEGIQRYGENVEFITGSYGMVGRGEDNGYLYMPKVDPSYVTLKSLDWNTVHDLRDSDIKYKDTTFIRPLNGNWYLYRAN